jgi:hypothetical protein
MQDVSEHGVAVVSWCVCGSCVCGVSGGVLEPQACKSGGFEHWCGTFGVAVAVEIGVVAPFCLLCVQDVLQIVSMFASFKFKWPPALMAIYDSLSFSNFNIELLAPECSFSVNYATKWFLTESIPIMLVGGVLVVLGIARVFQWLQRKLLGRLPMGATSDVHLVDVCLGILLTGLYYTYFGECGVVVQQPFDMTMYVFVRFVMQWLFARDWHRSTV